MKLMRMMTSRFDDQLGAALRFMNLLFFFFALPAHMTDSVNLNTIFEDPKLEALFAQFLKKNLCDENYNFFKDVQSFKTLPEEDREERATEVCQMAFVLTCDRYGTPMSLLDHLNKSTLIQLCLTR